MPKKRDMLPNESIGPKVHTGAASAGVGGGAAAVLLIWLLQGLAGIPEAQFSPERVVAITAACAWLGGYVGGWIKSDTSFQQARRLRGDNG